MKKIMWIVAVLPVVVASMMLQVIPDMIPHKIGIFIFPIVILCVTFFWHLLIGTFEKKTVKANTDKERMEANSSARVLCVVGLSQAIMFGIMNYCILYSSCVQENVNGSWRNVHVLRKEVNGKYLTATDSYSSAISGHKYRTELQVYTYSGSKSEYLELHSTVLNF